MPRRASFADWVTGEAALGGRRPTPTDLDYHLTTLFPPVRLRGFLELRYLDAAAEPWWPALAAVTSTLLDDPVAADAAAEAVRAGRRRLGGGRPRRAAPTPRCTPPPALLAAAVAAAPPPLRPEVEALAELVERGAARVTPSWTTSAAETGRRAGRGPARSDRPLDRRTVTDAASSSPAA